MMTANMSIFAREATFKDNTRFGDLLRKFLSENKVNKIGLYIHNSFMFICCLIIIFCVAGWIRKLATYLMG